MGIAKVIAGNISSKLQIIGNKFKNTSINDTEQISSNGVINHINSTTQFNYE